MKCFLDMDGVLADFVGGVCELHQRPSPYLQPEGLGVFDMAKLWGITAKELWSPINTAGVDFWHGLNKTQEADELVNLAERSFGQDNVAILTAPSMDPGCVPGKRAWIRRHYPKLADRIIFGSAKKFLASPDAVLFDDRDKNISEFVNHGGYGVTVPRPWNGRNGFGDVMGSVRQQLAAALLVTSA